MEWWERLQAAWVRWLGQNPRRGRVLLAANGAAAVVVVVAAAANGGFSRGLYVWLACVGMLFAWLAISPTKTIRWVSVMRLFTASTVWAAAIAVLSGRVVASTGLPVRSAGPSIGVAAVFEEALKLAPLAAIAVLAPGRIRRFGAVDWLLAGLACGMGFQAAEDMARKAIPRTPSLLEVLDGASYGPRYGLSLFGGSFTVDGATYPGHYIETALIAAGIGLAVCTARRGRRLAVWLLPVLLWFLTVCDHAGFNAVNRDQLTGSFAGGRSTVPAMIHQTWRWTGRGANRGWLLLAFLIVALLVDARRQAPSAGTGGWIGSATSSLAATVRTSARAGATPWRVEGQTLRGALAGSLSAATGERRRREIQRPPVRPEPPWWTTRLSAGVVGVGGVAGAALGARSLARTIGTNLTSSGFWFAGLLESFGDWWDGLGPGGQAAVVAGGLALVLLGGGLLLAPEIVIPALVTGGGAVVPGLVIDGGAIAVPTVVAGTGVLSMAAVGSAASGSPPEDGAGRPQQSEPAEQAGQLGRGDDFAAHVDGSDGVLASLDEQGILDLYIKKGPSTPSGGQMFDEAMNAYGSNVQGVRGTWLGGGDLSSNFDAFQVGLRSGLSPEAAAGQTFTGRMAARYGFTNVRVLSNGPGKVVVEFFR